MYQQTVLNAFRETNDALAGTVKKRQESAAQIQRVASLREYARLSRVRFNNGYAGYLEVLYAENELFAAELASVQSYADGYTQLVGVYKAMGGGWVDLADRETAAGREAPIGERAAQAAAVLAPSRPRAGSTNRGICCKKRASRYQCRSAVLARRRCRTAACSCRARVRVFPP